MIAVLSMAFGASGAAAQVLQNCTPIQDLPVSIDTSQKPQSKVWTHGGHWWAVLPNSSGTFLWKLDRGFSRWTEGLQLSASTTTHADALVDPLDANVTHVLLFTGTSSSLVSLEYVAGSETYQPWSARSTATPVTLDSGVETATIAIDSTGRLWLASDGTTTINVRHSNRPYTTFSPAFTVGNCSSDDLSAVIAMPNNTVGVFWSDQTTNNKRFRFRVHQDTITDSDPNVWSADEVPAEGVAEATQFVGGGMADDHVNLKVGSDGTLYAVIKTEYDRAGYPVIGLLVRRPNGSWDPDLYPVAYGAGSRGIGVLNELERNFTPIYQAAAAPNNTATLYRQTPLTTPSTPIAFSPAQSNPAPSIIEGPHMDPTSTKQNITNELVVIVTDVPSGTAWSVICASPNQAPAVEAGSEQTVSLPAATATLNGTVTDDGLPSSTLTTNWSKVSGPGTVTFANAAIVDTTATFDEAGTYVLRLTASDGALTSSDDVTIAVATDPGAPAVTNPGDQTNNEGAPVSLQIVASDPNGHALTYSAQNLPLGLSINSNTGLISGALTFTAAGNYTSSVTARDTTGASDTETFTWRVTNVNLPPNVVKPADQTNKESAAVNLQVVASDPDGDPLTYSAVGLPPGLSIGSSTGLISGTIASNASGASPYSASVTVRDPGLLSATQNFLWTVNPSPAVTVFEKAVAAGSDDAEQSSSGSVNLSSDDLELVTDGSAQTVGLRFTAVTVPPGATIVAAYVQFQTDETGTSTTNLTIQGQAADNAATFTTASGNVSSRPRTTAAAPWAPPAWNSVGERGLAQRTPDLSALIQEIVNRQGWAAGNALAIIVTGSGRRTAESFNGTATGAPRLHVEYTTGGNQAPVVGAGADQTLTLPTTTATLDGTVTDDGLPSAPTATWIKVSGPGTVTFGDASAVDTTATFGAPGAYVLRLTANDGVFTRSDDLTITVVDPNVVKVFEKPVAAGSDDAEQSASGSVNLSSSDLELVTDGSAQTVGLRFTNITVPAGATIAGAYLQFQTDETSSGATTLTIRGQAADNPATFTSASGNVSTRPRTLASTAWSPPAWNTAGQQGLAQRSPDVAAIIQEIVSRPGWAAGNSLAIIITGSGRRTAESYDGSRSAAPLLHIEYR